MVTIEAAAIIVDGEQKLFSLPRPARHTDILDHMGELGYDVFKIPAQSYGFLTSEGKFVGRKLALMIAYRAHQLKPNGHNGEELSSDNVW